jgi:hypothetical protein
MIMVWSFSCLLFKVGVLHSISFLVWSFAGLAGTYMSWAMMIRPTGSESCENPAYGHGNEEVDTVSAGPSQRIMMAALAACHVMRSSSKKAYEIADRGMGAADILPHITGTAKTLLEAARSSATA